MGTLVNEEDGFRTALGRVRREPVARRRVCRKGSECLFLLSEFPGFRLAAIPGTRVTLPAEPNERGGRRGGRRAFTHTNSHRRTHTVAHAYTRTPCDGTLTPTVALSGINTHLEVCIHVHRARRNTTHSSEQYVPRSVAGCHACTDGGRVWDVSLRCVCASVGR